MTEEEQRSQRQQAFELIAQARSRVNPATTEHIAETAMRHADEDLHAYVRFVGWKQMVKDQEHVARTNQRQPIRSGHFNKSGRYRFFQTPWRIGELAKPIGEMNLGELQEVIAGYLRKSEEMADEASRLQAIADAMISEELTRVADLGEERALALYRGETSNV